MSSQPRSENRWAGSLAVVSGADSAVRPFLDNSCVIRRAACAVFIALVALALPALAMGHGVLVDSDPADGSTLTTTPYTLTATFAEEIDLEASTLVVENASGTEVARGTVDPDDNTMMTAELPHLPDGVYTVHWTTITPEDNGIERGTFRFAVGATASTAPTPVPIPGDTIGGGDLVKTLALAAIVIGGIVAFVVVRGRQR